MTTEEFSNEFDVLINSYSIDRPSGLASDPIQLDEYEKSVLLTLAQENLVKGLYNGSAVGESLEQTEELRKYLDTLIKTDNPQQLSNNQNTCLSSKSTLYKLKDDVWFIIYESVDLNQNADCNSDSTIQVIPIKHDEWHRTKNNPFRKPNKKRVVRLDSGDFIAELISEYSFTNYKVRYISKPEPIILLNLEDGLEINGLKTKNQCKLHTALHRTILDMAVKLALTRVSNIKK